MERNLNFRVWDKRSQTYIYYSQPDKMEHHQIWIRLEGGLSSVKFVNPRLKDFVLEQSLGLKDKYKMVIYESDILKVSFKNTDESHYWEVIWKDAAFKIRRFCKNTGKTFEKYINPSMVGRWEIIGTKHLMGKLLEV